MKLRKVVICSGAIAAAALLLTVLLWPHPTTQGREVANWKPTSSSEPDNASLVVAQDQRDAGGADHNSPVNDELNVAGQAGATVAEATNARDPVYKKARRAAAGSEQPTMSAFASELSPDSSAQSNEAPVVQGPPVQVHLPAPFLPLPDTRQLSSDDAEAVGRLAQEFNDSVVNSGQSPADPAYLRAWMTAEWLANERYRSYFGWEAFDALRNTEN
jgi:hypothetical protein